MCPLMSQLGLRHPSGYSPWGYAAKIQYSPHLLVLSISVRLDSSQLLCLVSPEHRRLYIYFLCWGHGKSCLSLPWLLRSALTSLCKQSWSRTVAGVWMQSENVISFTSTSFIFTFWYLIILIISSVRSQICGISLYLLCCVSTVPSTHTSPLALILFVAVAVCEKQINKPVFSYCYLDLSDWVLLCGIFLSRNV